MKYFLAFLFLVNCGLVSAQDNSALIKHFEEYYKQMKAQGDVQGIINGITHLNILLPSIARKDTLAYVYMSEGDYTQALHTIGIDQFVDDSDIALQVKAVSLKAIKQPKLAVGHFEIMFKREPNTMVAYELAELYLQIQKFDKASNYIEYGIANSDADQKRAFYEAQSPYEVSLKSAFMCLKALTLYNKDKDLNIDIAIDLLDEILKTTPNFNLVQISKNELLRQKQINQAESVKDKN